MNHPNKIFCLSLLTITFVSNSFPGNTSNQAIEQKIKQQEETNQIDEAKAQGLRQFIGAIAVAGLVGAASQLPYIEDSALGTGLKMAAIPAFFATIAPDKTSRYAWSSMGISVPLIAGIGGLIVSDVVCGIKGDANSKGLLGNIDYFKIKELAQILKDNKPTQEVAAILSVSSVGVYVALKQLVFDSLSKLGVNKSAEAYEYLSKYFSNLEWKI